MTWQSRFRDIALAGGALVLLGCTSDSADSNAASSGALPGVPCGNANPDPCICGRPDASPERALLCDQKNACTAAGGTFDPSTLEGADGAVISAPHCTLDGGSDASDDAARE